MAQGYNPTTVYQWYCEWCRVPYTTEDPEEKLCPSCRRNTASSMIRGASPEAPVTTTPGGGKHSLVEADYTQLDGVALSRLAEVMYHGSQKYGRDNWRAIGEREHVNHALMHLFAYTAGDVQDDHLVHAACRLVMALAVKLRPEFTGEFVPDSAA
jgi:hypothetical protein